MLRYVITGLPGTGKSTLFNEIVAFLKNNGLKVGGIRTPEVRGEHGRRIGFKVVDLITGEEAWLSRVDCNSNIRVGKYGVLIDEASRLVEKALTRALSEADVIGVDEVGPMELKLPVFRSLLLRVLNSSKPAILVVHYRLNDPLILRKIGNAKRFEVTIINREYLRRELPLLILKELTKA